MSSAVNPDLLLNLKKFGVRDAAACFNCGNCTAVCSLSSESAPFPRKTIRYLQLGLDNKLMQSPEPWLCYYCGDCSDTCPRQANPGEVMMGLRRYLTSRYDWTGISRLFYTSKAFEVLSILVVAALVGLAFYFFHGPMPTDRVALNVFAPNTDIEILDLILLAVLSFFLLSNAFRMSRAVMGNPGRADPRAQARIFGIPCAGVSAGSQRVCGSVYHPETIRYLRHPLAANPMDCPSADHDRILDRLFAGGRWESGGFSAMKFMPSGIRCGCWATMPPLQFYTAFLMPSSDG